jgi:5-methylcytosine-specific restriction endonuclease McrA
MTRRRGICLVPGCGNITTAGRCPTHPSRKARANPKLRARIVASAATCWICGGPPTVDDPFTADHIVPQLYGGQDTPANLQAAHRSCNGSRGAAVGGPVTNGHQKATVLPPALLAVCTGSGPGVE